MSVLRGAWRVAGPPLTAIAAVLVGAGVAALQQRARLRAQEQAEAFAEGVDVGRAIESAVVPPPKPDGSQGGL